MLGRGREENVPCYVSKGRIPRAQGVLDVRCYLLEVVAREHIGFDGDDASADGIAHKVERILTAGDDGHLAAVVSQE